MSRLRTVAGDTAQIAGLVVAAATVGIVSTQSTSLIALLVGPVIAILLTVWKPEASLAIGVTASLFGELLVQVSRAGTALLIVAGFVALVRIIRTRESYEKTLLGLAPIALLVWLFARLAIGSGLDATRALLPCVAVIIVLSDRAVSIKRAKTWIAWSGLGFVLASTLLGQYDLSGTQFEGVSGNPNRMALGLLFFLPFFADVVFRHSNLLVRIAMLAGYAGSISLIARSGSEQGAVGVVVMVALLLIAGSRRLEFGVVGIVCAVLAVIALWTALQMNLLGGLTTDTLTLSGRTGIFRAGFEQVSEAPWLGSGAVHISDALGQDLSAHDSIIGVTATAGLFAGALWCVILVRVVKASISGLRAGQFAAAAGASMAVSQLVQSVEYVPVAWAAFGVVLRMQTRHEEVRP